MVVAGIICVAIGIYGLSTGSDFFSGLFFIGIGALLLYLKATEKERFEKHREKIKAEKQNKLVESSNARFKNSSFAAQLINDFSVRNWIDLDYKNGGCQILKDKIVTPNQTYLYIDYGLANLDTKGCEQLAVYIGQAFRRPYQTSAIEKCSGGFTGGYSGYVDSSGGVSISPDYSGDFHTIGYKIYSKASVSPPKPTGNTW